MKSVAVTLTALLLLGPLSATRTMADTQSVVDKTYDAVLLRPLAAFGLLVGGVMFVPAILLGSVNGPDGMQETWDIFVANPYDQTFDRELGEF